MTDPRVDPTPVILARMEVKLDNALTDQARHGAVQERHDRIIVEHGNRLVALETTAQSDNEHQNRSISTKALAWTAGATVAAFIGLIITLFIVTHGG